MKLRIKGRLETASGFRLVPMLRAGIADSVVMRPVFGCSSDIPECTNYKRVSSAETLKLEVCEVFRP